MHPHDQAPVEARARLLAGRDMWSLPAVPELGFDGLVMSDGPVGVRGTEWSAADPSIALPSPTALAATWDTALLRRAGELLAGEARRKGVQVLLAPTVNLHRSPLGGRHFECFSEDPLLTGELAAGLVQGVQSGGVAVTVKHFVANDFETERMTADVVVSERALRELYLLPFEIVVRKASPYGIMTAYNGVNGTTMSEHDELVNGVLRGEWGFDGFTVSDWFGARDTVRAALGGLDVAMPGPDTVYGPALAEAVRAGEVPEEVLDQHVQRVLELARRTSVDVDLPEVDGQALAREIAARSFTLLRNEGVLPFEGSPRVALIGGLAKEARVMGGGSAQVFPAHVVSPLEGLESAGLDVSYARGADPSLRLNPAAFTLRTTAYAEDGTVLGEFPQPDGALQWVGQMPEGVDYATLGSVAMRGTFTPDVSGDHQIAIEGVGEFRLTVGGDVLFDGTTAAESDDPFAAFFFAPQKVFSVPLREGAEVEIELVHRLARGEMPLPFVGFGLAHREPTADPDTLLAEAEAAAAASDIAVVVVGTSKEVESEGFDRTSLRLPGRQDELVGRVAAANPRTIVVVNAGSPVEMPWRDDVAAVLLTWFPGQEAGHALADVLTGRAEPGGRLPTTWPAVLADCPVTDVTPVDGVMRYDEGVFIGYRAWQRSGTAPAYEFGSGLGYTTWSYEKAVHEEGVLHVTLRNTGSRPGREVVQTYLAPAVPDENRPSRWLAAFAVAEAAPGESVTVTLDVPERSFCTWQDGAWRPVPGGYVLHTGHSLTDTPLTTRLDRS
ncbi:beta-glucosidase [Actinocorallia populi]|uniref:beta-glucosidase n=1 Tax=Actinocorallia populi TaxID=2079200 RepID=UPI000D08F8AC|nr:glycoside hydrolase family 3 C-terminal domain-containing protein [Actinocorallia populi]